MNVELNQLARTVPRQTSAELLLEVKNLKTHYRMPDGRRMRAVDGVSLQLREGETLGIVGESGCGKSTLIRSLLNLFAAGATVQEGEVLYQGKDILSLPPKALRRIRGAEIALVSQSAMNALDPVYRIGDQIVEGILVHRSLTREAARARAAELFQMIGIDPKRLDDYPHQLSGGMRQRAVIAAAMAADPRIIIADEPTTALDVIVQAQILERMIQIQKARNGAMIIVTHDISVVAQICDTVAVMYAGRLMEYGPTRDVFERPQHPYTMGLKNAFPNIRSEKRDLVAIPGHPPDLAELPSGCRFHQRCPFVEARCRVEEPPALGDSHSVHCHFPEQSEAFRHQSARPEIWMKPADAAQREDEGGTQAVEKKVPAAAEGPWAVLEVRALAKYFEVRQSWLARLLGAEPRYLKAVDGIDLTLRKGETVGVVGESGCGKTTVAKTLLGLYEPSAGEIYLHGRPLDMWRNSRGIRYSTQVQMIFQNPYESMNPRFNVAAVVEEPLRLHGVEAAERRERVRECLALVGMTPADHYLDRYPHELSGGQRQRVAIARALTLEPSVLVADEPVSMLDVSIRAEILNLLKDLIRRMDLSVLFISHDLSLVRHMCDRIAVMYLGRIVEEGPTEELIRHPTHPYSRALLQAVPVPDPRSALRSAEIGGEPPDPIDLPAGCAFAPRCPEARERCRVEIPALRPLVPEHVTACHFAEMNE